MKTSNLYEIKDQFQCVIALISTVLTKKKDICKLENWIHFSFHCSVLFISGKVHTPSPPPACDLCEGHIEDAKGDPEGSKDGEEGELDRDASGAALVTVTSSAGCRDQVGSVFNHLPTITIHILTWTHLIGFYVYEGPKNTEKFRFLSLSLILFLLANCLAANCLPSVSLSLCERLSGWH